MNLPCISIKESRTPAFYGRRQGRALRGLKKELLETLLPQLIITPETLDSFFCDANQHVLEIGFGGGDHLVAQARLHPSCLFLGMEVFKNGIASLLDAIHQHDIKNIRLFPQDGRLLFPFIPEACFNAIYVLFPDPWPKKKHQERRLLSPSTFQLFANWLKPSGHLVVASDDPDYLNHIKRSSSLINALQALTYPVEARIITTRYEEKALKAGRSPEYLMFRKRT